MRRGALLLATPLLLTGCIHGQVGPLACRPDPTATVTASSAFDATSDADLQDLARRGDLAAARVLGERYEAGLGAAPDFAKALEWYERAAFVQPATRFTYVPAVGKAPGYVLPISSGVTIPGDAVALADLARLYRDGRGVARDPAHADELASCTTARGASRIGATFSLNERDVDGQA